jgi:predicted Zn-dependent protease with MMP-like domain
MDRERFEKLVLQAVEGLPEEFLTKLSNIDIVVEDYPSLIKMRKIGLRRGQTLLGLYEGVPQTKRGSYYGLVPPDKITIFQKTIEAKCGHDAGITAEVQRVVRHEIAHHFGISDARLRQIEKEK